MRKLYHSSLVMSLFPFHMIPAGVDIIICGGGIIGKQYVEQVTKSKLYKLLFVADMKWKSFDIAGSRLCSPEEIRGKDAYIVLAIKSEAEAGKMREMLLGMGVKAERIVWNIVECSMVGHCKKLENKWDYFYKDLGELTPRQRRYFEELHRLLRIGRVKDIGFTRVGAEHDGGYIMLDDFADHGVAYSFGIGWNTDWDHDMATRGYQVYMYDHTINPPKLKRSELHFFKEGLGNPDENAQLNTLPHFMKENGHCSNKSMILKMDIERGEWEFLRNIDMDVLKQFDQIVMEVHGIVEERRRDEMLLGFMRILQTHAVVHIHPNNYGKFIWIGDKPFGETLEITFANREKYHVTNAEDVTLPINLDTTCEPAYRDVFMGKWNTPLKKPVEVPKTKLKPATSVNLHNNPNQHWGQSHLGKLKK